MKLQKKKKNRSLNQKKCYRVVPPKPKKIKTFANQLTIHKGTKKK